MEKFPTKTIRWMVSVMSISSAMVMAASECTVNMDQVPANDSTILWSPITKLTWDHLQAAKGGALEKVVPSNALIEQLVGLKFQEEAVMPKDAYAIYAGKSDEAFEKTTKQAVKEKFGFDVDSSCFKSAPNAFSSYSVLVRNLEFKRKFYLSKASGMTFTTGSKKTHLVQFFGSAGFKSIGFNELVKVLQYEPASKSFILSIATQKEDENLIIYQPPSRCSMRQAIESVKQGIAKPLQGVRGAADDGWMHANDVLKIPVVKVDVLTDFTDQVRSSLLYYKGESDPWVITQMRQQMQFDLKETGAKVKIQTDMHMTAFGGGDLKANDYPRNFICDRAFYVFFWKSGAELPYVGACIDDGACLTEFKAN